jgi:hypothetical protein
MSANRSKSIVKLNNMRGIDEINEVIYQCILNNKHLEFETTLSHTIDYFTSIIDYSGYNNENKCLIPETNVRFSYQDMIDGYSVFFDMAPSDCLMNSKEKKFPQYSEFSASTLYSSVYPAGELYDLYSKALKEINRFRSDFLDILNVSSISTIEWASIRHTYSFDFDNNIIDSSISFEFTYMSNPHLNGTGGVVCGVAYQNHYANFLVGTTSKHMMTKFFLLASGIESDIDTHNHKEDEIKQLLSLADMVRI